MIRMLTSLVAFLVSTPCCAMQADAIDVESIVLEFRERLTTLEKRDAVTAESLGEAARSATNGARIEDLTPAQLARLEMTNVLRFLGDRSEYAEGLRAHVDDPGAQGAAAAVLVAYWMLYVSSDEETNVRLLRRALTHPGLGEAVRTGAVPRLFSMAWVPGPELRRHVVPEIIALENLLDQPVHPWVAADLLALEELYTQLAVEGHPKVRARAVPKMVKAADSARKALGAPEWDDSSYDPDRVQAEHVVSQLRGAAVQRRLVGLPAPDVAILWSSDKGIGALSDLRGKIVVLDFWATWCGPCIRDFPKLRALQDEFKDEPVVILGVTKLWGRYSDGSGKPRSHAQESEIAAMPSFMEAREMTWPVVFAHKQLFAEFGVRGIPHIAIIGADGRVVSNGVDSYGLRRTIQDLLALLEHKNGDE